jgi:hypothetical protein
MHLCGAYYFMEHCYEASTRRGLTLAASLILDRGKSFSSPTIGYNLIFFPPGSKYLRYLLELQTCSIHFFYIRASVHRNSKLIKSNKMQDLGNNIPPTWSKGHVGRRLLPRYYDLYQRLQLQFYVLHVVTQTLWPVPEAAVTVLCTPGCYPDTMTCTRGCSYSFMYSTLLLRHYDLYQRLQLQFYALLMMGAIDTRNM